jgi:ABC-type Fe3+/spermidine/putrescine transport system ATPase subunit
MTGQAMADNGGPRGPILEIDDLTHRFGEVVAVDNVSITAEQGEFLTILGESGSGKTTLLRVISGLETPSEVGALRIAGADVSKTPASDRNCTTVFQHYALFPHMTVGENVGYGLKVRGIASREREQRSREALDLVRLGDKYDRRVHQLSGGERQRVALARALVTRPAILLLDEPLGALDEKLRLEMQVELLELHNKLGMTFIYITHSQEEALTMSNRVILMRQGRIVQEGPPRDLFDRPVSRFVADFMGVENLLEGALEGAADGTATARLGEHTVRGRWCGIEAPRAGEPICVCVRAERIRFATGGGAEPNRIACRPGATIYKGKYLDQMLETGVGVLNARIWDPNLDIGSVGHVWWHEEDCVIVPAELAEPRV